MRLLKFFIFFFVCLISSCHYSNNKNQQTSTTKDSVNTQQHTKTEIKFKDFELFYNKFISDSLFQISNIKFPIQGVYADHEGEEEWTKEKWPLIKFNLTENNTESVDSIYIIQSENSFFYGNYCTDCGFSFEMSFKKIKHQWYLVYRQENNY
jgi:hypothetical protein